jgi:hypothetical protein
MVVYFRSPIAIGVLFVWFVLLLLGMGMKSRAWSAEVACVGLSFLIFGFLWLIGCAS